MTKVEFIAVMVEKYGMTKKDAVSAYDAVFEIITETLIDGTDVRTPIGTFKTKEVEDREFTIRLGEHTGEKSISPAHRVVKFTPSSGLKAGVR